MSQTITFGIVGGYGATGRMVVSELRKSTQGEILVGGRDLAQAKRWRRNSMDEYRRRVLMSWMPIR